MAVGGFSTELGRRVGRTGAHRNRSRRRRSGVRDPFGLINPGPIKIWIERADGQIETGSRTTDAISTEEDAPNAGAD
jgi:hypothetical protein